MGSLHLDNLLTRLNAFVEDTCVLVVIAYLLTRGPLLALLFKAEKTRQDVLLLGGFFGLVALTGELFPGARYPYVPQTLIATFSTLSGGLATGSVAAGITAVGALLLSGVPKGAQTIPGLFVAVLLAETVRRFRPSGRRMRLVDAFLAGSLAQSCAFALRGVASHLRGEPFPALHAAASIAANGVGVALLQLVVQEARLRADGARHRLEAERARALVEQSRALMAETQLAILRARMHPHFLFNTLSAIAALCGIAPDRAEAAIIRLGEMMRRVLASDVRAPVPLAQEMTDLAGYLEIQQYRLGDRLRMVWDVDPAALHTPVPPFALVTLLENAVSHGIAPKGGTGRVRITVRPGRGGAEPCTLVAVRDDGVGMTTAARRALSESLSDGDRGPIHGLMLIDQQLRRQFGHHARLRLFSRPDIGTLVVFRVPAATGAPPRPP